MNMATATTQSAAHNFMPLGMSGLILRLQTYTVCLKKYRSFFLIRYSFEKFVTFLNAHNKTWNRKNTSFQT
jgi:hypothetical protein